MKTFLPKMISAIIPFVFFCVFSNSSEAKPIIPVLYYSISTVDSAWVLQTELKDVKAYYKITQCGNEQVVFLKFVNSGNTSVTVTWDDQMQFSGETTPRKIKSTTSSLILLPGEISLLSCNDISNPILISKPTENPVVNIESFSFLNITVTSN